VIEKGDMVKVVPLYLECVSGRSNKFWEIGWLSDVEWMVVYGRIGSRGTPRAKKYQTSWQARAQYNKIIQEKMQKGYKVKIRPIDRPDCFPFTEDYNLVVDVNHETKMATILTPAAKTTKMAWESLQLIREVKEC